MKATWLVVGSVIGCVIGAGVAACGGGSGSGAGGTGTGGATPTTTTPSGTTTTTSIDTGTTSGTTTTGTGSTDTGTTSTTTTSTTTGTGGDAGVCKPPTTLHPPHLDAGPGTIFCPFSAVDGGKNEFCVAQTEHCCEPTSGNASCQPSGTTCATGDTDWQCEDPVADCPSGMECCAAGASIGISTDPSCANFAHKFHGTACVAAGSCAGIVMCTSDAECPSGKHCVPFGTKGNAVGGCN
jgi:hypothetical protein